MFVNFQKRLQKQAAQRHAIFKMVGSRSKDIDRFMCSKNPATQKFVRFQVFFLEL